MSSTSHYNVYLLKALNITLIAYSKEWLTFIRVTKEWTTHGPIITTVAICFSHNISSTKQLGHHLHLRYLQPREQYLYGRG
jgi:hypothetical protein